MEKRHHKKKCDQEGAVWNKPREHVKAILLVEDRDDCRVTTKWFLSYFGYAIDSVRSGEEALQVFDPHNHDLVLTDNRLPGMTGAEMAHIIKLRSPTTPVVMYGSPPPEGASCCDLVFSRSTHLLAIKVALDELIAKAAPA